MQNRAPLLLFKQVFFCVLIALPVWAQAIEWPQVVDTSEGPLTVYQPQPETLEGNTLSARAAMSFTLKNEDPTFGVFWFTAKLDTDRSEDQVTVRNLKVSKVKWPESKDAGQQRFISAVNKALENVQFKTGLSLLTASLESAKKEKASLADIKNDPPEIIFKQELAVLLNFDGEPKFSTIDNSSYERALNTPMTVVRDTKSRKVYLTSGYYWYEADKVLGPYQQTQNPPSDLVQMAPKPEGDKPDRKTAPLVVVSTKPTELISSDGKADWKTLSDGKLMYVSNTETPWLRELATGNMYVLLSGRWFRAKQESGPWTFVRADELPQSFADIPPASDLGGLRVSVAGTDEAEEAVLDAAVPQTAAISRKDASFRVEYDGSPKFQKISGTHVAYAINTSSQVIEVEGKYYAVDNGVWFKADTPTGPWKVADEIPKDEIAKIPPSSPVYNITYVDIYESTPEVVYVGYTPGYMWSYPYFGVPIYGTGWHYPPYWGGGFYYPRPPTWGLNVGYNPWTGWTFGLSWSNGFFNFGMSWGAGWHGGYRPGACCGGWYGGGYRGPVVINTGDINIGNRVNVGNKLVAGNTNNFKRNIQQNNRVTNLYKNTDNQTRLASKEQVKHDFQNARASRDKANNVFADRDGNVLKHDNGQWQERAGNTWKSLPSEQQQAIKQKAQSIDRQNVQQKVQSIDRQQVQQRAQSIDRERLNSSISNRNLPSNLNQRMQSAPHQQRMKQLNGANRARQMGMQRQQMRQSIRSFR
ncbi:carbohydrate-binding family V/XII [Pseudomaricurvus sp.]|uniref:carbohydrate-binding family V/XII n=1 Tax=Pseudomaricurvus sp. TaxID=2004510 RepID=UPI003F6AD7CB